MEQIHWNNLPCNSSSGYSISNWSDITTGVNLKFSSHPWDAGVCGAERLLPAGGALRPLMKFGSLSSGLGSVLFPRNRNTNVGRHCIHTHTSKLVEVKFLNFDGEIWMFQHGPKIPESASASLSVSPPRFRHWKPAPKPPTHFLQIYGLWARVKNSKIVDIFKIAKVITTRICAHFSAPLSVGELPPSPPAGAARYLAGGRHLGAGSPAPPPADMAAPRPEPAQRDGSPLAGQGWRSPFLSKNTAGRSLGEKRRPSAVVLGALRWVFPSAGMG